MIVIPELRPNQIGVTVKVHYENYLKLEDETLYCTVNANSIALELYPKKPIIIIDKDAAKMLLSKIAEVESAKESSATELRSTEDLPVNGLPPDNNTTLSADHFNSGKFSNRPDYIVVK